MCLPQQRLHKSISYFTKSISQTKKDQKLSFDASSFSINKFNRWGNVAAYAVTPSLCWRMVINCQKSQIWQSLMKSIRVTIARGDSLFLAETEFLGKRVLINYWRLLIAECFSEQFFKILSTSFITQNNDQFGDTKTVPH